jgi:hypothetical protein
MKKFTLYWKTGQREVVKGDTIAHAMMLAGYGGGALGALDFFAHGDDDGYVWDSQKHNWVSKNPVV